MKLFTSKQLAPIVRTIEMIVAFIDHFHGSYIPECGGDFCEDGEALHRVECTNAYHCYRGRQNQALCEEMKKSVSEVKKLIE